MLIVSDLLEGLKRAFLYLNFSVANDLFISLRVCGVGLSFYNWKG
jgi:hypothetical protein